MATARREERRIQTLRQALELESKKLAKTLRKRRVKVVLAESCTGGLIAASLAGIPGISDYFCGSQVVYRDDSKLKWLGIPKKVLNKYSAVSPQIAQGMAKAVLKKTPEAQIAASVTGHLGPNAPKHLDGVVFVCIAVRGGPLQTWEISLARNDLTRSTKKQQDRQRLVRQSAVSQAVLFMVRSLLI